MSKSGSRLDLDDVFPKCALSLFRVLFVPLRVDLLQPHRSMSKRDGHLERTLGQ